MCRASGGTPEAWADANTHTFGAVYQRQQERLAGWQDDRNYLDELRLTDIDWLASMCDVLGIDTPPEAECAALSRDAGNWIKSRVVAGYPDIRETVHRLSQSHALYTASGGASFELRLYLQALDIDESIFGRLYGADLVNWPKLDAEYHRRIFRDAGVDPAECIVVDDGPAVVGWAKEAGAYTVLVDPTGALVSDADLVVASLAELPAALRALD